MRIPSRWGRWPVLGAALLAITMLVPPAASGADRHAATAKRVHGWSARQASRFWTPARMRRAEPVEQRLRRHASDRGGTALPDRGTPHRVPSRPAAGAASSGFEPVPDPTAPVSRVNGVVFFDFLFGLARCSGTAVNGRNLSIVVTAGHCVNIGWPLPIWFTERWAFVPAYRFGQHPYGVFPAKWLGTTRGWLTTGSPNSDVGIAVVGRNERGQRLGAAVGGAGIAWGLSPEQVFDVHGYPAEKPYNGRRQRVCEGAKYLGHDPYSFLQAGPLNLAVECKVTEGASGGGWTIRHNTLNSVTSYGYEGGSQNVYGPYFGQEVARLYRQAVKIR